MIEFDTLSDLRARAGHMLGTSSWRPISQANINGFAEVTGDRQWIHTDPSRTRAELNMPAIAHGYLTLSLLPVMMAETFSVSSVKRMINYGSNKVRFLAPVAAGARVRGVVRLAACEDAGACVRAEFGVQVEIEGQERPALHAEVITLMYE